ncbi:hypothetical protein [Aromatoleum buckelii]|uniref:Uncharacterized protein n=1 Tax=Aromatoleum buckelii TaxID=200254 RepID=A0ABX1N7K7_9RHOO|nr:hypothetical protein [Aromatoleum buckelii]MCK0509574.1 hypothetical protein [Aromatoleum buckelii]
MTKNYNATKTGFTVVDSETFHTLRVLYQNDTYQGLVEIPEQGEVLPLAPWRKGENPFQDDYLFEGAETGFSDRGTWWFTIRPSTPFSQIMAEVEALNQVGFFKRLRRKDAPKLIDVVPKQTKSGYLFWDINDDLGKSCEEIMQSTPEVQMAYGYARRAAVAGMYLQGIVKREIYDHVFAVFKSLQLQTGQTVDFQKQAFLDSIDYMQTYSPFITSFFVKTMVPMVQEYEGSSCRVGDANFFKAVLDLAHSSEDDSRHN